MTTRTPIAAGWLHVREPRPEKDIPPLTLLDQTGEREGTWRYATTDGRKVILLGEVRDVGEGDRRPCEIEPDLVDAVLEELGLGARKREGDWVVPISLRCPREIVLAVRGDQIRVESELVSWDEIGPDEERALALFLCRAQAGLRFVRCERGGNRVVVASRLRADELETGLAHALAAVLAAGRMLAGEASALLLPEVAAEYLGYLGEENEIAHETPRI